MSKDSLVVRNNWALIIKRNHNKVSNSVVRKIINHTCIHVSGRSVKKEQSHWSNGFSQWYKICEFKVSCVINVSQFLSDMFRLVWRSY